MSRSILALLVLSLLLSGCGGKSKEELQAEGAKQLKARNYNGAIVLLKNALEKDQNYLEARHQLAKAYLAAGKPEQAEKEYQKLQRQDPSRAGLSLELAALYNLTGRGDLALSEAQNFLKGHPDSAEAWEVLGIAHATKANPEAAEKDLQQALRLEPARSSARISLASLYAGQGKEREARALLDQVISADAKNPKAYYTLAALELSLGHKPQALAHYQKIAELDPTDTNARYQMGMLYLDAQDLSSAHKVAAELLGKYPKRPEGHLIRGLVYYGQKNYDIAVVELQKTLQIAKSPTAHYYLGLSHYNRDELELAMGQFHKALDLNPRMSQVRLVAAAVLLKQKRADEAIAEARRAVESDPRNALAHNLLGSAYLAKGEGDQAIRELDRALELDPKLADAHLKKGILNLNKGRTRDGEIELQTAVQVAPDVLATRFLVATYHTKKRDFAKAAEVLRAGLKGGKGDAQILNALSDVLIADRKEPEALKALARAKELDPAYFGPYFNLALYYSARGAHDKAAAEYAEVLKRDPKNLLALERAAGSLELQGKFEEALSYYTRARDTGTPEGYLALANFQTRRKQADRALATLEELLKREPRNVAALEMKGRLLGGLQKHREALKVLDQLEALAPLRALPLKVSSCVALKDYQAAAEHARSIIKKNPDKAFGYSALSSVYQAQNDQTRAVEALKDGIKAEPGNDQVRLDLGDLYLRKRDYSQALASYQEVLKRRPGYFPARFAQGTVYERMGKKGVAAQTYREILKKSPDYVPALNNLACLCAEGQGSREEALRLADRAARLEPKNPAVMDTMGYALLLNGKKDEARKLLEQACGLLPGDPTVHYHLALAHRELGNRAQALKSLQKSLELGDFPEVDAARLLLAQLKG